MLNFKSNNQKKNLVYYLIILAMFIITGSMIYSNYLKPKNTVPEDFPGVLSVEQPAVTSPAPIIGSTGPTFTPIKISAVAQLTDDEKFKLLKEIVGEVSSAKIGKENPFQPYE